MAKNTQLANATVEDQADTLARLLDDGYLRLYTGSQPASADTAITSQTLLATLRFSDPSAPASDNGVLEFAAIADGTAVATGTATWFRCFAADGTTVVMDGTVGLSADTPNLTLNAVAIPLGATVQVNEFLHTVAKAISGY